MDKDNYIVVEVQCRICGRTYDVEVRSEDYNDFRAGRKLAQDAFPYLDAAGRELLISQTCDECWQKLFKEEE